ISVSALAIDPTSEAIVYVATSPTGGFPTGLPVTGARIFKSTDGALNWRQVPIGLATSTSITSLAIDPRTPSTIYAAAAGSSASQVGVFKSNDNGESWGASANGLPTAAVRALAIDPTLPSHV